MVIALLLYCLLQLLVRPLSDTLRATPPLSWRNPEAAERRGVSVSRIRYSGVFNLPERWPELAVRIFPSVSHLCLRET